MRALLLLSIGAFASCQCGGGSAPSVRITTPSDWSFLEGNGPHPVSGEVSDPDELLTPDRVTWKSDRDGRVGQGAITTVMLSPGEHRLTLEAIDRDGNVGSAQVSVFVRLGVISEDGGTTSQDGGAGIDDGGLLPDGGVSMSAPVVTITQPLNGALVDEGTPIVFEGTAIDAEDGPLAGGALVWTSDRAGVIGSGTRVTFGNAALGAHRIVLTATDRSGRTGLASISLTVVRPGSNRPPVVVITRPTNGAPLVLGMATALLGSASDLEDGMLQGAALVWRSSVDGAIGSGTSAMATLTQGVHTLTLTATDSMGATGTASVTVSVNAPNNQPPTATITSPASMQTVFQGTSLTFIGTGQDPEDGALMGAGLAWSSSLDGPLGTGSPLSTTALTVGDHTITLVARDAGGNTGTAAVVVRVLPQNRAPTVTITAPSTGSTVTAGTSVSFTGTAIDPEDGALTGMALRWSSSRDGALGTGSPFSTAGLSAGAHTITLSATDSGGRTASASVTLTVMMTTMNVPPIARLSGPSSGQATQTLTFDASSSSDVDGMITSYRFDFGDGSPVVSGAAATASRAYASAGTFTVTVTVTDDRGATATASLTVTITPFIRVPVVALPAVDDVGGACGLWATGNRIFVAWTSRVHPGVHFGEFSTGAVQAEVVDAMGFNTGGVVDQHVQLQVEANGTPHLLYVRDNQVFYATKSGTSWLRERVDSAAEPYSTSGNHARPSLTLGAAGAPSIVYGVRPFACGFNCDRVVVAVRGGPSSWTRAVVSPASPVSSNSSQSLTGDLTYDGSRLLFPIVGSDSSTSFSRSFLVGWAAAATSLVPLPSTGGGRASLWAASSTRAYLLSGVGVHDLALSASLGSSTVRQSLVETFSTTQHAIAADSAGLPRLVVNHGNELESVWAGPDGFWRRLELGRADPGLIDVAVDGANETRACFVRAGKLMIY
ncbi:MAG: PKD domain-containing protein [Myxococcales bacterium]|nr:PKD domain-containing protein [Myxococcales bacterium]